VRKTKNDVVVGMLKVGSGGRSPFEIVASSALAIMPIEYGKILMAVCW
jgi:hypothetical protein